MPVNLTDVLYGEDRVTIEDIARADVGIQSNWFCEGDGTDETIKLKEWLASGDNLILSEQNIHHDGTLVINRPMTIKGYGVNSVLTVHSSAPVEANGLLIYHTADVNLSGFRVMGNENRLTYPITFPTTNYLKGTGIAIQGGINIKVLSVVSKEWAKHCFDVSADDYTTGDPTEWVTANRSNNVNISFCYASGGGDDNFTTHQSDRVVIDNCVSEHPSAKYIANNSNCYEIDDGSKSCMVTNSFAKGGVCGVQVKGHSDSAAPQDTTIDNVVIEDCNYGVECYNTGFYGDGGGGYSTTAYGLTLTNITILNAQETFVTGEEYPFFFRVRSYSNVVISNIVCRGGGDISSTTGCMGIASGVRNFSVDNAHFINTISPIGLRITNTVLNGEVSNIYGSNSQGTDSVVSLFDNEVVELSNIFKDDTFTSTILIADTVTKSKNSITNHSSFRATSRSDADTSPRVVQSYSWVDGGVNIGKFEGFCTSYGVQLSTDADPYPQVKVGVMKASSSDSTRTSYYYIAISDDTITEPSIKLQFTATNIRPYITNSFDIGSVNYAFNKAYMNNIRLSDLPVYADDSSAGSGGLAKGDIYITSTGEIRGKL